MTTTVNDYPDLVERIRAMAQAVEQIHAAVEGLREIEVAQERALRALAETLRRAIEQRGDSR